MPEPLGKPGGSRTFSADGPPQAPAALSHRSLPKCAIKFGSLFNPWNVEVLVDGFAPELGHSFPASDHGKPNGQFVITPRMSPAFVQDLPVGKFHGIGSATSAKVNGLRIYTGMDMQPDP